MCSRVRSGTPAVRRQDLWSCGHESVPHCRIGLPGPPPGNGAGVRRTRQPPLEPGTGRPGARGASSAHPHHPARHAAEHAACTDPESFAQHRAAIATRFQTKGSVDILAHVVQPLGGEPRPGPDPERAACHQVSHADLALPIRLDREPALPGERGGPAGTQPGGPAAAALRDQRLALDAGSRRGDKVVPASGQSHVADQRAAALGFEHEPPGFPPESGDEQPCVRVEPHPSGHQPGHGLPRDPNAPRQRPAAEPQHPDAARGHHEARACLEQPHVRPSDRGQPQRQPRRVRHAGPERPRRFEPCDRFARRGGIARWSCGDGRQRPRAPRHP